MGIVHHSRCAAVDWLTAGPIAKGSPGGTLRARPEGLPSGVTPCGIKSGKRSRLSTARVCGIDYGITASLADAAMVPRQRSWPQAQG